MVFPGVFAVAIATNYYEEEKSSKPVAQEKNEIVESIRTHSKNIFELADAYLKCTSAPSPINTDKCEQIHDRLRLEVNVFHTSQKRTEL